MTNVFFLARVFRTMPALLAVIGLAGCSLHQPDPGPEERHAFHGVILGLDAKSRIATIKHGDIKGFMGPMTMEYAVKDPTNFAQLRKGETVDGTVFVRDGDFWVGELKESK